MSTDRFPDLHCDLCGKKMGVITLDELEGAFPEGGGPWVCFDCEPDPAGKIPSLFDGVEFGDIVVIDTVPLQIDGFLFNDAVRYSLSLTHERVRERECLSSYTYLNTHPNQGGERAQEDANNAVCPFCGEGELRVMEEEYFCPACLSQYPIEAEIILPRKLIEWETALLAKDNEPGRCEACLDTQFQGYGQYCRYHHALLVEQSEDGSLGWLYEE
jgi:uncharacterized protein YbaR (Trm112 family)